MLIRVKHSSLFVQRIIKEAGWMYKIGHSSNKFFGQNSNEVWLEHLGPATECLRIWTFLIFHLKVYKDFNRIAQIICQCRKITILSCHRCLIWSGVDKRNINSWCFVFCSKTICPNDIQTFDLQSYETVVWPTSVFILCDDQMFFGQMSWDQGKI
jgi:hypothetical protein